MEGARAVGIGLPISVKHSVEVCRFIRGKELGAAKKMLEEVIRMKKAVPYKRFNFDLGHKSGMMSARYPVKTCKQILKLLESVEVNAQFKGMNTSQLEIVHIAAHKSAEPYHPGRFRGRKMKRAHVEVIVQEKKKQESKEKDVKKKRKGGAIKESSGGGGEK